MSQSIFQVYLSHVIVFLRSFSISFRPLEHRNQATDVDVCGGCSCCARCACCTWYPYEDEEAPVEGMEDLNHPYLAPTPSALRVNDVLRFS